MLIYIIYIMYRISFKVNIIDKSGEKTLFYDQPYTIKCKNRREIADILKDINTHVKNRYKDLFKDKEIDCFDILIIEPAYEILYKNNKRIRRKLKSNINLKLAEYRKIYCRKCGRILTNPQSVRDGIGPECKKGGKKYGKK